MLQQAAAGAGAQGAQAGGESRPNGNSEWRVDTRELTRERGRLESLIRAEGSSSDETAARVLRQNAAAEHAGEVDRRLHRRQEQEQNHREGDGGGGWQRTCVADLLLCCESWI